jgi:hypothetical protein
MHQRQRAQPHPTPMHTPMHTHTPTTSTDHRFAHLNQSRVPHAWWGASGRGNQVEVASERCSDRESGRRRVATHTNLRKTTAGGAPCVHPPVRDDRWKVKRTLESGLYITEILDLTWLERQGAPGAGLPASWPRSLVAWCAWNLGQEIAMLRRQRLASFAWMLAASCIACRAQDCSAAAEATLDTVTASQHAARSVGGYPKTRVQLPDRILAAYGMP